MTADPFESDAAGYTDRAQLLAELGRFDDAVTELGTAATLDPDDPRPLVLLARVQLAAGRPEAALAAADAALALEPGVLPVLAVRGMALVDLRRYREAAELAQGILRASPHDGYAQRTGAALLGESRNGQEALDAAWRATQLTPQEPQAHLVLSVVAARMQVFDLAEKAYREALRLDPYLAEATADTGVLRLEQRRQAEALEYLAATAPVPIGASRSVWTGLHQAVAYGAGYSLIGAIVIAWAATSSGGFSRLLALLVALTGAGLGWWLVKRMPELSPAQLPQLWQADRTLMLAVGGAAAGLLLLLTYVLIGTPWPLVAAIGVTAVAEVVLFTRRLS
ncbi:tetratricopeptide repeat protein [Melissospora conviva]|uniref:tetratricopeptide repeat protein n=1 Tax=Melissospora conviva TaxID=3388432 RepID=UPI003B7E5F7E